MRVVHVGNFSLRRYGAVYYAVERKLSNGFIRNGDFVYDFSDRDTARMESLLRSKRFGRKRLNRVLLRTIDAVQPQLLLLGHTELFDEATLDEARRRSPGLRIAQWNVDPIWGEAIDRHLRQRLPHVDAFFCTTAGDWMDPWRGLGAKIHYLPNPVDPSVETLRNDERDDTPLDLVYCGHDYKDGPRQVFLRGLKARTEQQGIAFRHCGCLGAPSVFGQRYIDTLAQSRMGLNYSRSNEMPYYSSDRIGQLTGNGLLTFSQETPGLRTLFSDEEMVYFTDLDDLMDRLAYYKHHDDEARAIARRGRLRAHASYNSQRIARFIREITFGQPLSEAYEWAGA
jgi:glycosyltransferase involved in cell wall biosynthesis